MIKTQVDSLITAIFHIASALVAEHNTRTLQLTDDQVRRLTSARDWLDNVLGE